MRTNTSLEHSLAIEDSSCTCSVGFSWLASTRKKMLDFSERLTFAFWGFWMAPVVVACVFASSDFHSVERYLIMGTVAAMVLHHLIELTKLFIHHCSMP